MSKVVGINNKTTAVSAARTAQEARPHTTVDSVLRQLRLTATFGLTITIVQIEPQMYLEVVKDLRSLGFMISFEKSLCTEHEIYLEVDWAPTEGDFEG